MRIKAASLTLWSQELGGAMKDKKLCIGLVCLLLSLSGWCESVFECERKSSKDAQFLCTAAAMVNPAVCEQISSKDGIHYCRAMVASNSYGCEKIDSPGKRQSCLMAVRDKQRDSIWSYKTMH